MSQIKIKTENGISTWREFDETRLVDSKTQSVIGPAQDGYIEVKYTQYKVVDLVTGDVLIPETVIKRTYYVRDNPPIMAPDNTTVLLPSKQRYTNWGLYTPQMPLAEFFRAVINDTLESYPDLEDNAIIPDWSQAEIDAALETWTNSQNPQP